MTNNETGIQIVAADEADLLGGNRLWKRVDLETLRTNLHTVVAQLRDILPAPKDEEVSGFRTTQVQVALTIGAKGQVGILGTGAEANIEASLTLTFERNSSAPDK